MQGQVAGQTPRLHLRTTAARGADVSNIETPLKRFRRFTKQAPGTYDNVHDTALMRVKGVRQGSRLRFAALDTYDGEAWRPNPDTSPPDSDARFLRLDSTIDNPSPGRRQKVHVEIRYAWRLRWLPTIGALDSLEFDRIESSSRRDNVVFNPATQTALMGEVVRGVDDYHFTARVPDDRLTPRMEAAQGVDEALYVRASYLNRIAEQYRRRTPTPMRALFAAARALKREGRYSNGATEWEAKRYPAGNDAKRLGVGFVLAPQMVGDDEQYAATMALLAARLNIPARVVVGAVVPRSGVVRGRDVHAWIEVQLSDGSWRTMPTETFMGDRPPKRKVPGKLPPNISTWDPPSPPPGQRPQQEPAQPKKLKKKQEQPPAHDSSGIPLWPLAVLVLIGAIPLAKWWRRRRRRDAARTSRRIVGAWDELTDSARDLGAEWSAGDTRPAEARSMGTPVELAQRADLLVYAAREPSDEDVADYWRDIDTAIGAFRRRQPRWRRIVAPINPLSLLKRR